MRTLLQDLRYGLRTYRSRPGFTAIAVLTLTLGIGGTAAIFSVVDAVLLRPLPYPDPQRLVFIFEDVSKLGFPRNTPAPGTYTDVLSQTQIFDGVAAMASYRTFNLTGSEIEPEMLHGAVTTQNLFRLMGARAVAGRVFRPEEDRPGAPPVAVISHALWMRRFGGETAVVGKQIRLNDQQYTVIGVMPREFRFPSRDTDVWLPIAFTADQLANRGSHYLTLVARLKPGITLARANADLKIVFQRMARVSPDNAVMDRYFAEPLQDTYTHASRAGLMLLMGAVLCILLIACANVANLLLSRAASRRREIAVRTALGAAGSRILRQVLTESAALAAGGGALGILLALWCFNFLKHLIPQDLSAIVTPVLNLPVLAFAICISLASSLLFGMAPAVQLSRINLHDVLKEGGRGSTGTRRQGFRHALVISEVALSVVLLVGSGLLLHSFARLRGLDPGFRAAHVLRARLEVPRARYGDFNQRCAFFTRVLERVRSLPGVKSAGFTSAMPLTWDGGTNSFTVEGVPRDPGVAYDANDRVITPGYFETMRIPLRGGRLFTAADAAGAEPVAMINQTMARKFWPNQDPLGKRFKLGSPEDRSPWMRIVGIVSDVRQMRLDEPPRQEMYFPYQQSADNWMVPRDLVIRTAGNPMALAGAMRSAVWSVDKNQPVSDVMSAEQLLDQEVFERRVQTALLAGFAIVALMLACVGVYGVLSYAVTQRTAEIGVRVALGASTGAVFRTIVTQGLTLAAAGLAAGVGAALLLSRLLQSLLFGTNPADPLTYIAACGVFGVVALLACYFPARRAAHVDPLVALRYE